MHYPSTKPGQALAVALASCLPVSPTFQFDQASGDAMGKPNLTGRRIVVQEHGGALAALRPALTDQGADVARVATDHRPRPTAPAWRVRYMSRFEGSSPGAVSVLYGGCAEFPDRGR